MRRRERREEEIRKMGCRRKAKRRVHKPIVRLDSTVTYLARVLPLAAVPPSQELDEEYGEGKYVTHRVEQRLPHPTREYECFHQ
tara:strand:+ start:51 stop:302 length:252 start_codon:yes stop_codon:yes gene_type:complete